MTNPYSEESFELGYDDTLNILPYAGEGSENVPALGRSLIAESYIAAKLEVHFHFRLAKDELTDFCTVLKRADGDLRFPHDTEIRSKAAGGTAFPPGRVESIAHRSHEAQALVPVYASEFVEEPQFVVPSIVRLQLLDSCSHVRRHRPDFVHPAGGGVSASGFPVGLQEGALFGVDGESDGARGSLSGVQGSESPSEVFEGASHVLEGVPDDYAQERGRFLAYLGPEDVLAAVRIGFVGESIRLTSGESGKLVTEFFQMLTCSPEFEPGTGEGIDHD